MDELKVKVPIVALEGAAFAGKTTILNHLGKYYSDKVNIVPEVGEYVGGDKNFPSSDFKDLSSAKASTYFFVEIEKQRCKDALKLYEKNGLPIILDRCTPFSSLLLYSLLELTAKKEEEKKIFRNAFDHALSAFSTQVEGKNIFLPNNIIYIKPKNKRVFEARFSRGTKNMIFAAWGSFSFLNQQYKYLLNNHFSNSSIALETENTLQNLDGVSRKIIEFIDSAKKEHYINTDNIFKNFLGQKRNILNLATEELIFTKANEKARNLIYSNKKYGK